MAHNSKLESIPMGCPDPIEMLEWDKNFEDTIKRRLEKKMKTEKMEIENPTRTYINCDCTCSILEITDWKDIDESFISLYVNAYQEKGNVIWWTIKRRIKAAWYMLRGKEFCLYEVCIPKEQLRNTLKEYLAKAQEGLILSEGINGKRTF